MGHNEPPASVRGSPKVYAISLGEMRILYNYHTFQGAIDAVFLPQNVKVKMLGFELGVQSSASLQAFNLPNPAHTLDVIHVMFHGLNRAKSIEEDPRHLNPSVENLMSLYGSVMMQCKRLVLDVHTWKLEGTSFSMKALVPGNILEANAIELAVHMATRTRSLDPSTRFEVYIVIPLGYLLRGQYKLTHPSSAKRYLAQLTNPLKFDPIQVISKDILLLARSLKGTEPFFAQLTRIHIMWDAGFVSWGGYWTSEVAPKIQSMEPDEATIKENVILAVIVIAMSTMEFNDDQQPVGSVTVCTDPTVPVQT
jgi:hypothetical protein